MKAQIGGGINPLILKLGTGYINWLTSRLDKKEPRYPLNRRLRGLQSRSGSFTEMLITLPLTGLRLRCHSPVCGGLIRDTEKQTTMDDHNDVDRSVAKGMETNGKPNSEPPATNMRKWVSGISQTVY